MCLEIGEVAAGHVVPAAVRRQSLSGEVLEMVVTHSSIAYAPLDGVPDGVREMQVSPFSEGHSLLALRVMRHLRHALCLLSGQTGVRADSGEHGFDELTAERQQRRKQLPALLCVESISQVAVD